MASLAPCLEVQRIAVARIVVEVSHGQDDFATGQRVWRSNVLATRCAGLDGTAAAAMWPVLRDKDLRGRIAMDSATQKDVETRFPGMFKLKRR